jgi:hypothetical protein
MFLANTVPHYVHGVSGETFPTPFADPPGKGMSSPTVNVLWALFNLAVGSLFFKYGKPLANKLGLAFFGAGVLAISLMLAAAFSQLHK